MTAKEKLLAMLREQKEEVYRSEESEREARTAWTKDIRELMSKIIYWLSDIDKSMLRIEKIVFEIAEIPTKRYTAGGLKISTPMREIIVKPTSRKIHDMKGRVDFMTPGKKFGLVLTKKNVWCWVRKSNGRVDLDPLDSETFFGTLCDLLR